MKFEDWEDIKYLTVKETAAALKTDEMVIVRILLEGFLETYVNESEVMIDVFNGDFFNVSHDFSALDYETKFNPKDFLIRNDYIDYIRQILLA